MILTDLIWHLFAMDRLAARVGSQYFSFAKGYRETVEVYDPSTISYIPKPRFGHCASLVGDKWYLFGGVSCPLSLIEEYDVPHQRWRQREGLGQVPEASFGVACTTLEGKIYAFGGSTSAKKFSNVLSELNVDEMVWRTLEPCNSLHVPILKEDAVMTSHGRCLVTFGGYGILQEGVNRSRASYDSRNRSKLEVWTNELLYYDLNKSKC